MKVFALVFCSMLIQQASTGEIYTRWGRTVCPHSSIVLYTGYVGKSHTTEAGSGANYICIHSRPQWGSGNVPGLQVYGAYIYGVEYELQPGYYSQNRPFSFNNVDDINLHDNDAVCVACYNPEAKAQLMVPGRQDCPNAMKLEYRGYLVSERYAHQKGEFVCLDTAPEARVGGEANQISGGFYPVQAQCGSLPCPPFVSGNEITCAVCTI